MPDYPSGQLLQSDAPVWRYMSLEAVMATLSSRQLRLTRLDRFDDPFEGTVPHAELAQVAQQFFDAKAYSDGPRLRKAIQVNDVQRRSLSWADEMRQRRVARLQCAHASCWRHGDESEGMWRLYCKDADVPGQGVAVRTTVGKLREALQSAEVHMHPIVYRKYHEGPPFTHELACFFHKRMGFAHEQEIRVLTYDAERSHEFTRYIAGFTNAEPAMLEAHRYVAFDLAAVVDELVISPYASDEYEERVRAAISSLDSDLGELIQLSELSEKRYSRGL